MMAPDPCGPHWQLRPFLAQLRNKLLTIFVLCKRLNKFSCLLVEDNMTSEVFPFQN